MLSLRVTTTLPPPETDPIKIAYATYQTDPSPGNLYGVVKTLQPVKQYALASNKAQDDAYLKSKGDIFLAQAVKTWDPSSGANLSTWASTQMQRLARERRENLMPVKIRDRSWLDNTTIMRATAEFQDMHGREPELKELVDATGLTPKRIGDIRRSMRKIVPAAAFNTDAIGEAPDNSMEEALDYLYNDADAIDRKILEMRTGYGGKYEPMQANDIAKALGVDPAQVTRRAWRISLRLNELHNQIQKVHGGAVT